MIDYYNTIAPSITIESHFSGKLLDKEVKLLYIINLIITN